MSKISDVFRLNPAYDRAYTVCDISAAHTALSVCIAYALCRVVKIYMQLFGPFSIKRRNCLFYWLLYVVLSVSMDYPAAQYGTSIS